CRLRHVRDHDDVADDLTKILLCEEGVHESNFCWHELVEQYAADGCLDQLMLEQSVCIADVGLHLDPCMQVDLAFVVCNDYFFCRIECLPFTAYGLFRR